MAKTRSSQKVKGKGIAKTILQKLGLIPKPPAGKKGGNWAVNDMRAARTRMPRARQAIKSDGEGNEKMFVSHGKPVAKYSQRKAAAIRRALEPVNQHMIRDVLQSKSNTNECQYFVASLADTEDINDLITKNAGQLQSNSSAGQPQAGKFSLIDCNMKLSIKNQSQGIVNLRVYECLVRKDIPYVASSTYQSILRIATDGFAQKGLTSGSGAITSTSLGGTIFQNPLFCAYVKVLKVRTCNLGAGNTLDLAMSNKKPRTINPVIENTYTKLAHGGYTRLFLVQHWGNPTNDSVVKTSVGVDNTKLDVYVEFHYNWSVVSPSYGNNTLTSNGFGTITSASIMSDKTGAAVADTDA